MLVLTNVPQQGKAIVKGNNATLTCIKMLLPLSLFAKKRKLTYNFTVHTVCKENSDQTSLPDICSCISLTASTNSFLSVPIVHLCSNPCLNSLWDKCMNSEGFKRLLCMNPKIRLQQWKIIFLKHLSWIDKQIFWLKPLQILLNMNSSPYKKCLSQFHPM